MPKWGPNVGVFLTFGLWILGSDFSSLFCDLDFFFGTQGTNILLMEEILYHLRCEKP